MNRVTPAALATVLAVAGAATADADRLRLGIAPIGSVESMASVLQALHCNGTR
jgi:hypothetical protein